MEPIAKGQTLVGVNESDPDFNSVEKSGGLKDVTLSIKQIPVHSHQESDLAMSIQMNILQIILLLQQIKTEDRILT